MSKTSFSCTACNGAVSTIRKTESILVHGAREHNLDVICHSDTIIDFGPGGGTAGGTIVATGTPQEIIHNKNSVTEQALPNYISHR